MLLSRKIVIVASAALITLGGAFAVKEELGKRHLDARYATATIEAKEAPILMVGVAMVMAVLIIVLGFYPSPIVGIASDASKSLIEGLTNYIGAVL